MLYTKCLVILFFVPVSCSTGQQPTLPQHRNILDQQEPQASTQAPVPLIMVLMVRGSTQGPHSNHLQKHRQLIEV